MYGSLCGNIVYNHLIEHRSKIMNLFKYYLRNRIFVITDIALIVVPILFLVIGWKWLTAFSYLLAVFGAAVLVVITIFGVIVLGDRLYLNRVRIHIDMQTYRRQQAQLTALPYSHFPIENIVEDETLLVGNGETAPQANSPQIGKTGNGKMGNGNPQNGEQNIPYNTITERRQKVYEFYIQHPNATLAQAYDELKIPDS